MSRQANDIEETVLGCLVIDPSLFLEIDLVSDDFMTEQNKIIYSTLVEMNVMNEVIDTITVADKLQTTTSRNWMPTMMRISAAIASTRNLKTYAVMVKKFSTERKAILIAETLIGAVGDDVAIDVAIGELMRLGATRKNYAQGPLAGGGNG